MAQLTLTKTRANGVTTYRATPINGLSAAADGEWFDLQGIRNFTIDVSGISGDNVRVSGSNDATLPANNTDDRTIDDITANEINEYTVQTKWLKIHLQAWNAGTVTATFLGTTGN